MIRVLQLVDSLDRGGTERVAVELANRLPRDAHRAFLATSRRDGPLAEALQPDVVRLRLDRRGPIGVAGLLRLRRFLREERIDLVHAHSTALFAAVVCRGARRRPAILWHDHYGAHGLAERPARLYGPAARRAEAVVVVQPELAAWATARLGIDAGRVHHLPNFVALDPAVTPAENGSGPPAPSGLPGEPESRVVCVANLRPQKDHPTLIDAFSRVAREHPGAALVLVGCAPDSAALERLAALRRASGVAERIAFLGERDDVPAILRASALGVLASSSEGTPLSLLEYGAAGLAVAATAVGGCPEVLDDGRAGVLVPPGDPQALAEAISALLADPPRRRRLGAALRRRIEDRYSATALLPRWAALYAAVVAAGGR